MPHTSTAYEMLSIEDARELVLSHLSTMPVEKVKLLDAVDRVVAEPLKSDMDVAPFAHSAMDGFALRAEQLCDASVATAVQLKVIAEVAAGDVYDGDIEEDECVRIMTGAELPADADAVVKYEIVGVVEGDGRAGSIVSFTAPCSVGSNVRAAGEEAKAGETIACPGDVIGCAGVGYLASCGVVAVPTYKRPRVAVMATGSELVPPTQKPTPGHIRESNSYVIAACASAAGADVDIMPIVKDTYDDLVSAIEEATIDHDFIITTGGAANGDYDFIKKVVEDKGELFMTLVNMRPGKAQTFGCVNGVPVFGLPGNPAAAYCGFMILIRPALRKMQGFTVFDHPTIQAALSKDLRKKDPRRMLLRATFEKTAQGYVVTPADNQSSGLFGVIQRSNCLAIVPEGERELKAGDTLDCILLDIPEEIGI